MNRFFLLPLIFLCAHTYAQKPSVLLDARTIGGYYQNYFDLGEYGFVVVLNKYKNENAASFKEGTGNNTGYYFSRDLSKRAVFKFNRLDNTSFLANSTHILMIDRNVDLYHLRVFDLNGKEQVNKKIDLNGVGLTTDMITRTIFTSDSRLVFEVYDLNQTVHLFFNDLMAGKDNGLLEFDIPTPSNDPLANLEFKSDWVFMGENKSYFMYYRKAADREFDPQVLKFHVATYDAEMNLFREYFIDDIFNEGESLFGKECAFSVNPVQDAFFVACLRKDMNTRQVVENVWKFAPIPGGSLKQEWRKDVPIIRNEFNKIIEDDGISVPAPPQLGNMGQNVVVHLSKSRISVSEDALEQLTILDPIGTELYNDVQMGNFESLNLDGYCVDARKMYSRFYSKKMNATIKSFCERRSCEAIDIHFDDAGNEVLIINDSGKDQVSIYKF